MMLKYLTARASHGETPNRGQQGAIASSSSWLTSLALGLVVGLGGLLPQAARAAEGPESAPASLVQTIDQIDTAANQRDLKALMQFYGPKFNHADGLNRQRYEQAVREFWERYSTLNYDTELLSWEQNGDILTAETLTTITGAQTVGEHNFQLTATVKSRQQFDGQRMIRQEILSEKSSLSAGDKPPTVEVRLPETVSVGQRYNLDAIVQEPLGEDVLLGAALEERVRPDAYFKADKLDLVPLTAGGIFREGSAPNVPDNYWITTALVRSDGMTFSTQRLQVQGRGGPVKQPR